MADLLRFEKDYDLGWVWHVGEGCAYVYSDEGICNQKHRKYTFYEHQFLFLQILIKLDQVDY